MFFINLKIAVRNLLNFKYFALLNMSGLALGFVCFLLIFSYVYYESIFDKYHSKAERIYRVVNKIDKDGAGEVSSSSPFPLGPAFKKEFSKEVEEVVRFFNFQNPSNPVQVGNKVHHEKGFFFADASVFKVFDFPFIEGDPESALLEPNSVVLTKSSALNYFGREDVIGEELKLMGGIRLKVTGVIKDIKSNSHFQFNFLASFSTLPTLIPWDMKGWVWNPCWTYVLLKDKDQQEELESKFPDFVHKYFHKSNKEDVSLYLQKLTQIHLRSQLSYEIEQNNKIEYIFAFASIGIFILILAIVNYINLSTASSTGRFKEIALKKVSGAGRAQLLGQFLLESIVLSLLSLFIALGILEVLLPFFSEFISESSLAEVRFHPAIILGLVGIGMFVGILSGAYPAFFLSNMKLQNILRGIIRKKPVSLYARRLLVIGQFVISASFIVATLVVNDQISYLKKKDLGFEKDRIITLQTLNTPVKWNYENFKQDLLRDYDIISVTSMNYVLGVNHNTYAFHPEGKEESTMLPAMIVGKDFIRTFGIKIVEGENFPADTVKQKGVLVNEALVKHMGWTNKEAIGKKFNIPKGNEVIAGVFKNIYVSSLHKPMAPFVLFKTYYKHQQANMNRYVAIRYRRGSYDKVYLRVKDIWNKYAPKSPMEHSELNNEIFEQYDAENKMKKITGIFTFLALVIAGLGLFGLTAYVAEMRSKEIGVRKVLGAHTRSIIGVLSQEFVRLIIIANLIACPFVYLLMNQWLNQFVSHVEVNIFHFLITGVITIVLAIVVTSIRAYQSAVKSPSEILKYD